MLWVLVEPSERVDEVYRWIEVQIGRIRFQYRQWNIQSSYEKVCRAEKPWKCEQENASFLSEAVEIAAEGIQRYSKHTQIHFVQGKLQLECLKRERIQMHPPIVRLVEAWTVSALC